MQKFAMVHGMKVCFGKLPERVGAPQLFLEHYTDARKSLPLPQLWDWTNGVTQWPMMRNSDLGCCVVSMKGHAIEVFTTFGKPKKTAIVPDNVIEADYFRETGGPDSGLVISDSLNDWAHVGLGGYKIAAWAALTPQDQNIIVLGNQLFGGVLLGVQLPANAIDLINAGQPWTDISQPPDPEMGHAILLPNTKDLEVITWGMKQRISFQWLQRYTTNAYVAIAPEWETDPAPPGIALSDMLADYQAMTGKVPPTPPTPTPTPTPTPPSPQTFQQRVDAIFVALERQYANSPAFVRTLKLVQSYVDAYIRQHPSSTKAASAGPAPLGLLAIVDAAFKAVEATHPHLSFLIEKIRKLVDAQLQPTP